jgi:hypothetical protein
MGFGLWVRQPSEPCSGWLETGADQPYGDGFLSARRVCRPTMLGVASDSRLATDERELVPTDHRSPITDHQSPITDHQSPITNHQSLLTSH